MTKNQKILLGCGGGGCLGLILLVIVCGVLIVAGVISAPGIYSANSNYNYNYNGNSNYNSNANNSNSNSDSSSSSSMTEDEKHKLYQAAGMTKDNTLMLRAIRKVGLGDGTGSDHQAFIKEHFTWAMKNIAFVQSMNSPDAARAYVEAHIDD